MNNKPILLGKLNHFENIYTLMGHMGDSERIDLEEFEILKLMDGFRTIEEIASIKGVEIEKVEKIFDLFYGKKKLSFLSEWNNVGWCEHCHVHISGMQCGICGGEVKKIEFSPPCDPFIGFNEEQKIILEILKNNYQVNSLPENALFLINNGIKNNVFFWEVEYAGKIILTVEFYGEKNSSWKHALKCDLEEILPQKDCILSEENIRKTIEANNKYLNKLENRSIAIMADSASFFDTKPLLYFSAGKESMIMLELLKKTGIKANILTVVTGVEFPEDITFIKKMKDNIESISHFDYYFYEDNGESIICKLNDEKKLSAKNPWCRVDFKRELKNKGTQAIYKGKDFVAYEGSRWYENDFRRRHPKVNFISDYSHQVWVHPLAEWTSFDVWLYIFREKLPINPVYLKGFQRTTCWLCPIVSPLHFHNSKVQYPFLWEKIKDCKLEAFEDDTTRDLPF